MAETKKIKTLRPVVYKDELNLGENVIADVASHVADRLIANGDAEPVAEKPAKGEKASKSEK